LPAIPAARDAAVKEYKLLCKPWPPLRYEWVGWLLEAQDGTWRCASGALREDWSADLMTLSLLLARQPDSPAAPPAPSLSLVRDEATVQGSGAQEVVFILHNSGETGVRVTNVVPHCSCTVAGLPEPEVVPPGGESRLRVTSTPPDEGEKRSHVDVHYEGQRDGPLSAKLLLKGRPPSIHTLAYYPPEVILRGLLNADAESDFTVAAVEERDSAPWIEHLPTDNDDLSVSLHGYQDKPGPSMATVRREYNCRAHARLKKRGRWQLGAIMLPAPATTAGRSPVQLRVMSDCKSSVEAAPDTIFASLARSDLPREFTVRFRSSSLGHSLRVVPEQGAAWLEVEQPVALAKSSPFAGEMRLRVVDLPSVQKGASARATVSLTTNDPNCALVEISVVILERE
jgi:hypothetical protein